MDTPNTPPTKEPEARSQGSWGTVVGILLILVLVVFAALYVWGERVSDEGGVTPTEQSAAQ